MLQSCPEAWPVAMPHHPSLLYPVLTSEKAARPSNIEGDPHIPVEMSRRTGKEARTIPIRTLPPRCAAVLKAMEDNAAGQTAERRRRREFNQ